MLRGCLWETSSRVVVPEGRLRCLCNLELSVKKSFKL